MSRIVAIAMSSLLLFAACSGERAGPEAPPGGHPEEAGIEVQVSGEPEETAIYQGLVEEYERQNPNVDVELIEIAEKDDHLTRLATAFSGGEPPDVFLVNFREYSQFAVLGAMAPVGPFIEEEGVDLDAYYPQPIEAFTYEGELTCMPQNISSLVVYYNEDLFEQAGLEPPAEGWTWADFRDTAIALTNGESFGLGIEPSIVRIAPFVWGNGGEIVDDTDDPTRFTLDTAEAREAVEFILGLVRDDRVVPSESDVASKDLETRFGQGTLGMLLSSRRDTPQFREINSLNWDVAPLPVGLEPAGILHSDAYCISAGSDEDAAFDFIRFATGETGQEITASAGRTVPSLQEVSRSSAFLDSTQPPEHSEVFLDGIPHIRRTPVISTWTEIEDAAEEILTRAFYEDGYTIDDAIEELDAATQPLFEEARAP